MRKPLVSLRQLFVDLPLWLIVPEISLALLLIVALVWMTGRNYWMLRALMASEACSQALSSTGRMAVNLSGLNQNLLLTSTLAIAGLLLLLPLVWAGLAGRRRSLRQYEQTEAALEQSESRNQALLDAIPDLILRIGQDGIYRDIVEAKGRWIVNDRASFLGKSIYEVLPTDLADRYLHHIQQVLLTGENQFIEYQLQVGDYAGCYESRIVRSGKDEVILIVRDITERQQAQLALHQSEATNRALIAAIPDLLIRAKADGTYRDIAGRERLTIYATGDFIVGSNVCDSLPPDLAVLRMNMIQQALKTRELQMYEQHLLINGRVRDEEVRIVAIAADEVLIIVRDITERKHAEAALRQSEARNRALVNAIPDVLIQMRADGTYLDVINRDRHKFLNAAAWEAGKTSVYDFLPLEVVQQRLYYAQKALETKTLQIYEQALVIDGQPHYEEVRLVATGEDEVLLIVRDITQRKEAEMSLKLLKDSFARFFPSQYLKFLQKESVLHIQLGDHVSKEMAVLFSDIRGFTSLSETMTPQESFDFVNAYLGRISPVIHQHNGFIVKYLGDGVMAAFPEEVDDAIRAGVEKFQQIQHYNQERLQQGFTPIQIGMGIHFGQMMIGMVGETNRMQGDAFSDTINLTARLEGLTKFYGVSLLISGDVLERMQHPERYHIRFLDRAIVQGRKEPIAIYEILDAEAEANLTLKLQTLPIFEAGMQHYCNGEIPQAKTCFEQLLAINPLDKTAELYLERIYELSQRGISTNWDGTWAFGQK